MSDLNRPARRGAIDADGYPSECELKDVRDEIKRRLRHLPKNQRLASVTS